MLCLVVDDDPAVREYLQAILQRERFETLQADGGTQALEIIQALDGGVDLLFTDIQMPQGDGLTFANAVRALFPSIPIVVISGYVQPDINFEFIEKPFSWATIQNVIRRIMAGRTRVA